VALPLVVPPAYSENNDITKQSESEECLNSCTDNLNLINFQLITYEFNSYAPTG
jgi:hypothetical protein